ncbi:hypothetical protein BD414DRAFT_484137 [Trametes punicea]|nr:hypothetical protein BD414DRAFT_484137 [Trametes punicea]
MQFRRPSYHSLAFQPAQRRTAFSSSLARERILPASYLTLANRPTMASSGRLLPRTTAKSRRMDGTLEAPDSRPGRSRDAIEDLYMRCLSSVRVAVHA